MKVSNRDSFVWQHAKSSTNAVWYPRNLRGNKGFMKVIKRTGPKTDLCGPPIFTNLISFRVSRILASVLRYDPGSKQLWKHFNKDVVLCKLTVKLFQNDILDKGLT